MARRIDAHTLAQMIISAANNLENNRELVNRLNVFPVPDGDTGSNMAMTMMAAAQELQAFESYDSIKLVASTAASAMLRGARGNSGVILSQIFRGVSKALTDTAFEIDTNGLAACLTKGTKSAFNAVLKPAEGTILTVIRECAHAAYNASKRQMSVVEAFEHVVRHGNATLEKTPEMLPQLKKAGVVDSGGKGLMLILEGMLAALRYEMVMPEEEAVKMTAPVIMRSNIKIKYAYCTEFLIHKKNISSSASALQAQLMPKGDSLVCVEDEELIKVHIHTNHPGTVLEVALTMGELFKVKIENMKEQAAALAENRCDLAVVAVAAGDGFADIFKKLGVAVVLHGGQTMNPSTDDIINAVNSANANHVIVLPNNKNIILSAQQAQKISEVPITVIDSKTIVQGICAMMAFNSELSAEDNQNRMQDSLSTVKTLSITHAVRNTETDSLNVKEGDYIALLSSKICAADTNLQEAVTKAAVDAFDENSEIVTIYYGEDVSQQDAEKLVATLEVKYPDIEFSLQNGGQPIYYYIISVE